MTILWILLVLSVAAVTWSLWSVLHDGRPGAPPASHEVDPAFLPPAARLDHHDLAA